MDTFSSNFVDGSENKETRENIDVFFALSSLA